MAATVPLATSSTPDRSKRQSAKSAWLVSLIDPDPGGTTAEYHLSQANRTAATEAGSPISPEPPQETAFTIWIGHPNRLFEAAGFNPQDVASGVFWTVRTS